MEKDKASLEKSLKDKANSIDSLESLTNLPVTDVIRFGPEKLGLAIN